jgi:hypothetical protein
MRSFPSGHAQLSCFAAAFVMVYVGRRVGSTYSSLWRPWLQLVAALLAAFCSLSRLADRRHHPWDVAAGAMLGGALGLVAARACLEPGPGRRWGGPLGTAASAQVGDGAGGRRQAEEAVTDAATWVGVPVSGTLGGGAQVGGSSVADTERELREVNPAC